MIRTEGMSERAIYRCGDKLYEEMQKLEKRKKGKGITIVKKVRLDRKTSDVLSKIRKLQDYCGEITGHSFVRNPSGGLDCVICGKWGGMCD